MQPRTNFDGVATPKRRRTRKSDWRRKWVALTEGATSEARAIRQTMRCPKLLSAAMPRVVPDVEALLAAGVPVGPGFSRMKFESPQGHKEKADFIGWMTARGVDAVEAEKLFFGLGPIAPKRRRP